MKVDTYGLAATARDGAGRPRAWRISTPDGVFWLIENGTAARLVRLPLPDDDLADLRPDDGPWAALVALATTAESEAAGRWVRSNP